MKIENGNLMFYTRTDVDLMIVAVEAALEFGEISENYVPTLERILEELNELSLCF